MKISFKGIDKFRTKVPALAGKRFAILPTIGIMALILSIIWMSFMYRLPGILSTQQNATIVSSLAPLFGFLLIEILGFLLASQMWFWRKFLKVRYGALAYQRILPFGLVGIIWVGSLGIDLYLPYFLNLPSLWVQSPLALLIMPLESIVGFGSSIGFLVRGVLGLVILFLGLAMAVRSFSTIGFDYMAVVYLYFPEESAIQQNAIYSALRNPLYSSMLLIGFGGVITTCTLYSLLLFALFMAGFYLFVHFVEEPELVLRFGEAFKAYRKSTPMFFVSPRNLRILVGFIFNIEG
jgi:protein-S-isoprenylcysteine O-methyltransferase Ste14